MTTRIGILGYGNLGKGVECAIKKNDDMELVAIFTRRNPVELKINSNAKIVSILPLWTVWNASQPNFKGDKREALQKIYEEYSDFVIDGYALIPHDPKYLSDEVHPNDEGFKFYGDNLSKELANILNKG